MSVLEERRTAGNYCSSPLLREHSITSMVTPVGAEKEIEYFFASDARLLHNSDVISCIISLILKHRLL